MNQNFAATSVGGQYSRSNVQGNYALMAADTTCRFIAWEESACKLLGFSQAEVLGRIPIDLFMPSADLEMTASFYSAMINDELGGSELRRTYVASSRSGQKIQSEWYHQTLRNESGHVCGIVALMDPDDEKPSRMQLRVAQYGRLLERLVSERDRHWRAWYEVYRTHLQKNPHRSLPQTDPFPQITRPPVVNGETPPAALAELTVRERQVAITIASGKRVKNAARALGISPHTVRNHLKSIFRKLEVHTQEELIARMG